MRTPCLGGASAGGCTRAPCRFHQWLESARKRCASYHAVLLAALFLLMVSDMLSFFALAAFAPAVTRAGWSLVKPARQLNLKRLGMLEIVYAVVFLAFITLTFRRA